MSCFRLTDYKSLSIFFINIKSYMSKNLLISLVVAACAISALVVTQQNNEHPDEYALWKAKFNPLFGAEEDAYRKLIFFKNL